MSVHVRSNGKVFTRHRNEKGKQVHTEHGRGELALKAAQEFDLAVKQKKQRQKENLYIDGPKEITYIDELAGPYYKDRKAAGYKVWFDDWALILNRRILPKLSQIPIKHLTQDTLVGFIMKEFPDASPTTHGNYLSYMKMMFNWGVERNHIEKNPLAFWKKRVTPQKDFMITIEDINKIKAVAPAHTALGIEFVANTGVRPGKSELLSIQWSNILWEQKAVRVFAEKTQKWRTIPLKPEFLNKLSTQKSMSESNYIIEYKGKKVSSIHQSFRRACRKAGIPDKVGLYDIRHWFCSYLLSHGTPVKTVSILMGHNSAKMTLDRYAHVLPGDADKAIEKLPSLD